MPLGPLLRDIERLMKDKSYQRSPIGQEAAQFLAAMRWANHSKNTLESYEPVIAWLAIDHDDFAGLADFCSPVGTQYLRDFLDRRWGDAAPATRAHRLAVLRSLFKWAVEEGICSFDPTRSIKTPKRGGQHREAHPQATVIRLLDQENLRDVCALGLMARMGLRKNDLRMFQLGHIDLSRNMLTLLHGKGGKTALLPIEFSDLRDDLYRYVQIRSTEAAVRGDFRYQDEYLLYPRDDPYRPMDPSSVHRWFKRCLDAAGLQDFPMHELRHTAGDDLWRRTRDIVAAQRLLRHSSVGTTQLYLHPSDDDLRVSMRTADASWLRDAQDA